MVFFFVEFIPNRGHYEVTIDAPIPVALLDKYHGNSVHASSMFSVGTEGEITQWFTDNLVTPGSFELPDNIINMVGAIEQEVSHKFTAYVNDIRGNGFKVWDVQNNQHSAGYLRVKSNSEDTIAELSGRADYYVTTGDATKSDYHTSGKLLCVVEVQSKLNTVHCELQMLAYLLILMNTRGLEFVWGALIQSDGNCKMFKATRNDGNCIYEQDGLFHVSHFPVVFNQLNAPPEAFQN